MNVNFTSIALIDAAALKPCEAFSCLHFFSNHSFDNYLIQTPEEVAG
jgi:hypothetical protein